MTALRVALYARYSSDLQNQRSAEDQLAALRQTVALRGWTETRVFADCGVSGASIARRPQVQALLRGAAARDFDIVLAEDLDRLSRDQEDIAHIYKRLRYAGVALETLSQGRVDGQTGVMQIGMAGAMNQLFLEQLAAKTRRGLEARVRAGFSGGGRCYGYAIQQKGVLTIDEDQASVVRRIYADYAAGSSARRLAHTLNAEGVPGPRGGTWSPSAIAGDRRARDGILCQELYAGIRVFNRRRYRKNPDTGRRSSVLNPPEAWIREPAPELRIVDQALWEAVQQRQADITAAPASRARRPKRLLSGLLRCGLCGGVMQAHGKVYRCATRFDRGLCDNGKAIAVATIERRVIAGVQHHLLAPEAISAAVRAFHDEMEADRREALANRAPLEREAAEVARRIDRATQSFLAGVIEIADFEAVMAPLKARRAEISQRLSQVQPAPTLQLHPAAAQAYRAMTEQLTEALDAEDGQELREALRDLIERVDFHPAEGLGRFQLTVHGRLAGLLRFSETSPQNDRTPDGTGHRGSEVSLGAGVGFEPTTFRL